MKKSLLAAALTVAAFAAQAETLTISNATVAANAVNYYSFTFTDSSPPSELTIFTSDRDYGDPEIFIFRNSVSSANFVATNDDTCGIFFCNLNSTLDVNTYASTGTYVIALAGFDTSLAQVLAGATTSDALRVDLNVTDNNDRSADLGTLSSYAYTPPSAVPVPGTLALLGVGMIGLAGLRRRSI